MKKILILLILQFTALMAFNYTMTTGGLSAPAGTHNSPVIGDSTSTYLELINLPECDANNPEVQFIQSNADWSTINSSSKSIFCVSPGEYTSLGYINITRSGTENNRRYIILNNDNDTHPGKLSSDKRANYKLVFENADYWTIDRPSAVGSISIGIDFQNGSSFNIVNRMFTGDGIGTSVRIRRNCNNNTIQNSRFTEQHTPSDMVAVNIIDYDLDSWEAKNNKIINNEFVDQNDGFQVTRQPQPGEPAIDGIYQAVNAEGTIVDSNIFYLNDETMNMENAIDMKAGSDNAANPVKITNNKMWGYDKGSGNGSTVIVVHYSTRNIEIAHNVIFNSQKGFSTGANTTNATYRKGTIDGELGHNLFYNCGGGGRQVLALGTSENLNTHDNVIIDGNWEYGKFTNQSNGSVFQDNILVDTTDDYYISNCDSTFTNSLSTTKTESRSLYTEDLVFTYDNFTNDPKTMILENALKP